MIHTEAGVVGQKGMNSARMGLLVNALLSDVDRYESCVPLLIALRSALNQRTLQGAIGRLTAAKRSVSGNVMLGQAGRGVLDVELTPSSSDQLIPGEGVISHANNFIGPKHLGSVVDLFQQMHPDSSRRTDRARALLTGTPRPHDVASFKKVFADHEGYPSSICRHMPEGENEDLNSQTLASVILDLGEMAMQVCDGNPCSNEYRAYRFPG